MNFKTEIEICPHDDRHCEPHVYPFEGGCRWCDSIQEECQWPPFAVEGLKPHLEDDNPEGENMWPVCCPACLAAQAEYRMETEGWECKCGNHVRGGWSRCDKCDRKWRP